MKAFFGATGVNIVLNSIDKDKKRLECIIDQYRRPKVFLHVVDKVVENDGLEEAGFHIECYPLGVNSRDSTSIEIKLSLKNWHKLTTIYDNEAGGGFFASRCRYDRCHINYYFD